MLKLCTSNKGLVWFTSSKIKICPTQNQMEPEANAFERCFALIRVLDIFQLPEVIFLEAVNHRSNQVGRFICLLLCQCTSVNCPLSKGCWSGNYRWSIYFAQYCCLTRWKYVNDTGEIHINTKEYQNKRSQWSFWYILKRGPCLGSVSALQGGRTPQVSGTIMLLLDFWYEILLKWGFLDSLYCQLWTQV